MDFGILGPLTLEVDGISIPLGAPRAQAVLGILLLHAPGSVSTDAIVDAVWGEEPPPTARHLVQVYVSQLRHSLGVSVTMGASGYAVDVTGHKLDVAAFEEGIAAARRASKDGLIDEALQAYDGALAYWRGPPLAGMILTGEPLTRIARLEEAKQSAEEERFETALALGHGPELVSDLERAVSSAPLRERFWAQLMVALYRSGRQADALDAYREARRNFADLGLEPSPKLRALERSILQHDPDLLPAPPAPSSPARSAPPQRRPSLLVASAILGGAVLVAGLGAWALVPADGSRQIRVVPHQSIDEIDTRSGTIVGSVRIGPAPGPVSVGTGRIWVGDDATRSLVEIDPVTLHVRRTVGLGTVPYAVQATPSAAWVANGYAGTLTRVDGVTAVVSGARRPEPTSKGALALAYGSGSLWAASQDDTLVRLDPESGNLHRGRVRVLGPQALAVGFGSVWIGQAASADIVRAPISGRKPKRIPIGGKAFALAAGAGAVWALTPSNGYLWRIDPRNDAVTGKLHVGHEPAAVAVSGGSVWIATSGALVRVDPRHDRIVERIRIEGPIEGLAAARGRLWVSVR